MKEFPNNFLKRILTKRRWLILVGGLLVVIGVFTFLASRPAQPSYQGKSARFWLRQVRSENSRYLEAFQAMNTNGVAFLLQQLQTTSAGWEDSYALVYARFPGFFQRHLWEPMSAAEVRSAAYLALVNRDTVSIAPQLLAIAATNIVPEIQLAALDLAFARNNPWFTLKPADISFLIATTYAMDSRVRAKAISHLSFPAGRSVVEEHLHDASAEVRVAAAQSLHRLDPTTRPVIINALAEVLGEGDQRTRHAAAVYLAKLKPRAVETIPAFIASLKGREMRIEAAAALGRFGIAASNAIPPLEDVLNGNEAQAREAARVALKPIRDAVSKKAVALP